MKAVVGMYSSEVIMDYCESPDDDGDGRGSKRVGLYRVVVAKVAAPR